MRGRAPRCGVWRLARLARFEFLNACQTAPTRRVARGVRCAGEAGGGGGQAAPAFAPLPRAPSYGCLPATFCSDTAATAATGNCRRRCRCARLHVPNAPELHNEATGAVGDPAASAQAEMEAQQRVRELLKAEAQEGDEESDEVISDDFFSSQTLRKRPWRRLLLVSNRTKAHEVLCDASRSDVGVVPFDFETMSLDDVLWLATSKMQGFRADSIALIAPSKPGAIGTVKGSRTTFRSLRRAETVDFWTGIAHLLQEATNGEQAAQEFRAVHLLTTDVAGSADGQRLIASLEALVQVPILATDDILNARRLAIDTEGARVARLYFNFTKLLQWTLLPDLSKLARGDHATGESVKTMGRAYVMYQRRRQQQVLQEEQRMRDGPGSPRAGAASSEGVPKSQRSMKEIEAKAAEALGLSHSPLSAGSAQSTVRSTPKARAQGPGSAAGAGAGTEDARPERAAGAPGTPPSGRSVDLDAAPSGGDADVNPNAGSAPLAQSLTERFAHLRVRVGRPASGSATQDSTTPRSVGTDTLAVESKGPIHSAKLKESLGRLRESRQLILGLGGGAGRGQVAKSRYGSLTLGLDMPMDAFASGITQDYFLSEIAAEIECRRERLRVAKVTEGLKVKVRIMDAPGDTPIGLLVKRFVDKLDTNTLLIDAEFGELLLFKHKVPPDANASPGKSPTEVHAPALLGTSMPTSADQAQGPAGSALITRLLLLSDRIVNADQLADATQSDVAVVRFSWRDSHLEGLLYDIRNQLSGCLVQSIGLVSHWKPGAVGLIKGNRFVLKNLAKAELRFFLSELAQSLLPGGCIDMFCVPPRHVDRATDDVCRALEDIMHTDCNRTNALSAPAPGSELEWAAWASTLPKQASMMLSFYFEEQSLVEWKMATPEAFEQKVGGGRGLSPGLGMPDMLQAARAAMRAHGIGAERDEEKAENATAGTADRTGFGPGGARVRGSFEKVHIPRIAIPRAAAGGLHRARVERSTLRANDDTDDDDDPTELIVPRLCLPKQEEDEWTPLRAPREMGRDLGVRPGALSLSFECIGARARARARGAFDCRADPHVPRRPSPLTHICPHLFVYMHFSRRAGRRHFGGRWRRGTAQPRGDSQGGHGRGRAARLGHGRKSEATLARINRARHVTPKRCV